MATIVNDCPHCGAAHAAFVLTGASGHPIKQHHYNVIAVCPACGDPIVALIRSTMSMLPMQYAGRLNDAPNCTIMKVFPIPAQSPVPEHIPDGARRAYEQGARCLNRSDYTPAAAMFRRCLEIALKQHSPDVEAWKLEKRIDKLAAEGRITKDLQAWAHRVRLDGNDALHEEEEFTKESAAELMQFTELLLVYLYTLPEKIKARISASDGKA